MTRIIGGIHGGRKLRTPPGDGTRPTSDRVREALFGAWDAAGALEDARVLDLYAGSGAVGLEALSRGAAFTRFVESDRRASEVLRANVSTLGLRDRAVVTRANVATVVRDTPDEAFDVVYLDPPYALSDAALGKVLSDLVDNLWLRPGARVVVERAARGAEPAWPEHITADSGRRYGETVLWYGHGSWT